MILKQIEHYKIESLIGKGGLGTVYLAQDLNLSRAVALKLIYPQFTNQRPFHEHIMQQARTAARLAHASIATIYNFDHKDNQLYLVIEHVPGDSLASVLGRLRLNQQLLRLDEALMLVTQVADALAYAHQEGMLHRNLKPSNILIKPLAFKNRGEERPFRAVVTDFGMTRLLQGDIKTAAIAMADSLPYLSPEQCVGNRIEAQSDLYTLGIILYQLTTGQLPFNITSTTEAMVMHSLETPPAPRTIQPGIPKSVEAIIKKALAKQSKDRYQDATQMADALRQAAATLTNGHLQAYPPGMVASLQTLFTSDEAENLTYSARSQRPIDGWLPVPDDELVAMLQAELSGNPLPNIVEDSHHDEPPSEALPVVVEEPKPASTPINVIADQHTPVLEAPRDTPQPVQPPVSADNQLMIDQVVITRPGRTVRAIKLDKDRLRIGRSRENDIVLGTPDVSRHHAMLERTSDGWQIVDLNSSGGTYWGGHRLVANVPEAWNQNQILRIGPYTLRWQPARSPLPFRTDEVAEEEVTKLHQIPVGGAQTSSRTGQFSLMVNPTVLTLAPGEETTVQVEIFNQGAAADTFSLQIVDLSPAMVVLSQTSVHLAPGTRAHIPVTLVVPEQAAIQAGHHPYQIVVRTEADRGETAVVSARVTVTTSEKFTIGVWPLEIKNSGECQVLIRNEGNVANRYSLTGQSIEPSLQFGGERGHVRLEPGQAATLSLAVASKKQHLFGRSRQYPFSVHVRTSSGLEEQALGALNQQPVVPSWVLPALEILAVVLFAAFAVSRFWGNNDQVETSTPVMAMDSTEQESVPDESATAADTAVLPTDLPPTATLPAGGPSDDDDADGLTNEDEANRGTDPQNADTDGDTLTDGDEVMTYLTNPLYADTDLDGFSDGDEVAAGTDPLRFPIRTATPETPEDLSDPTSVVPLTATMEPANTAVPAPTNPPPTQQPGNTAVPTNPPPTAIPQQPTAVPTQLPPTAPPSNNSITIQAAIVNDGTGWVKESGQVNLGFGSPVQAGDLNNNEAVRGFLTFDLSQIPANAVLESARLTFATTDPDTGIEGDPFNNLDCMLLEAAEFELPLDANDYDAFAFYIDCAVGRPGTVDVLIDVQDALDFDLTHLQIRLGFEVNTDNDGANDLYLVRTAPILEIKYKEP